tara:strand:+ start:164 stop:616 length:453 start_codon:yes stop_codon:yes gene_type:complete
MAYKGKYKPQHPEKYKGDPTKIIYRSLWERKFMVYCDTNINILQWASEEVIIPYRDPTSGKNRRYFPDFWIKMKTKDDTIECSLIEVKPKKQLKAPDQSKKYNTPTGRLSTKYVREVKTYAVNMAKFDAAKEFCADRKWSWKILTEEHLT